MQGDVTTACSYIGLHNCRISKFVDKYMEKQGRIHKYRDKYIFVPVFIYIRKFRDKYMEIQGQIYGNTLMQLHWWRGDSKSLKVLFKISAYYLIADFPAVLDESMKGWKLSWVGQSMYPLSVILERPNSVYPKVGLHTGYYPVDR